MFDSLLEKFGTKAIHKIGMVTTVASQVAHNLDQEFKADEQEQKNVAIDVIIDLLQKQKKA